MHRLIKIRIVRDLDHLEERVRRWMDNVFESQDMAASFRPAADFYETAQGCVVHLDVAGVAKEDLSITLVGQELIIRGRRLPPPPQGLRRFKLPEGIFFPRYHYILFGLICQYKEEGGVGAAFVQLA